MILLKVNMLVSHLRSIPDLNNVIILDFLWNGSLYFCNNSSDLLLTILSVPAQTIVNLWLCSLWRLQIKHLWLCSLWYHHILRSIFYISILIASDLLSTWLLQNSISWCKTMELPAKTYKLISNLITKSPQNYKWFWQVLT